MKSVLSSSGSRAVNRNRSAKFQRAKVGVFSGEIVVHGGQPYAGVNGYGSVAQAEVEVLGMVDGVGTACRRRSHIVKYPIVDKYTV